MVVPDNSMGTVYDVTIDSSTSSTSPYDITLDSDRTINDLLITRASGLLTATVLHESGILTANEIDIDRGRYDLLGGTIKNANVVATNNQRFTVRGGNQSTLDNVSVDGNIFIGEGNSSGNLRVLGGLDFGETNDGFWFQGNGGTVTFEGGGTVSGVTNASNQKSEIVYANPSNASTLQSSGGTLTIGPNVNIRVTGRGINRLGDDDEGLVIQGNVTVSQSLTSLEITGNQWRNEGAIRQSGGGTISLDGTFSTSDLGTWSSETGRLQILGELDNTGQTLDFTKSGGDGGAMTLKGGKITGGVIVAPDSSDPFRTNPGNLPVGRLDGVTIDGYTNVSIGEVVVTNGLTLQDTLSGSSQLEFNGSSGVAKLTFEGTQSIAGTGEIRFDGSSAGQIRVSGATGPSTLTIEDGITIRTDGQHGIVGSQGQNLVNEGTIEARRFSNIGYRIDIEANDFTNEGLMFTNDPSVIDVDANRFVNSGTLQSFGTIRSNVAIENSGLIEGGGLIDADVVSSGVIGPGFSPGLLTLESLDQALGGTLHLEIGGVDRGNLYDGLNINGDFTLNGLLDIDLISGFTPQLGDQFDFLNWGTATFGSYSFDFSDAPLDAGLVWDTSDFESNGTVSVTTSAVPEPNSLLLVGLASITMVNVRRKRK